MNKTIALVFALGLVLFTISLVAADGGYFPHPGYWIRPGEQKAIIFYENNLETMIVTSSFQGNAKDFVWIIPTPTKPTVSKASEKVFTNVAELARSSYSGGFGFGNVMMEAKAGLSRDSGVVVLESKQVDYYDVNVLAATSSSDLVKWFNENNYNYPEEYSYVLRSYIDKGWFFTAIKVSPESQGATEVVQDLKEGHPTPIKLVFLSDQIVFPLKISSVDFPDTSVKSKPARDEPIGAKRTDNSGRIWVKIANDSTGLNWVLASAEDSYEKASDSMVDNWRDGVDYGSSSYSYRYKNSIPITLYVIADGKYEADGFNPFYGNWVKKSELEKLGKDDSGKLYLEPKKNKYYLTALNAYYQKSQMDEDLFLEKSPDNSKVNAGPESWQLFLIGLLVGIVICVMWAFSPLGLLFIIGILVYAFSSSRVGQTAGKVLDYISLGLTFFIGLVISIIAIAAGSLKDFMVLTLLGTWFFLVVIMLIFNKLVKNYKGGQK